jgi:hypothetical protein
MASPRTEDRAAFAARRFHNPLTVAAVLSIPATGLELTCRATMADVADV